MSGSLHHVAAFYRFVSLDELPALQERVHESARRDELTGTVLLAEEGINGTVAGRSRAALSRFFAALGDDPRLAALPVQWSTALRPPFDRLRVKRKRELVPLGRAGVDPARRVGAYVPPAEWNELLQDPELLLLDARNDYEVRIGAFEGAVDPGTRDFRELATWMETRLDPRRDRKVALYCTGGIRCEKASALLLQRGFEQVFQLRGGILAYLAQVRPEASRFRGACFVFDHRVSLRHGLETGDHRICPSCGEPQAVEASCERCA